MNTLTIGNLALQNLSENEYTALALLPDSLITKAERAVEEFMQTDSYKQLVEEGKRRYNARKDKIKGTLINGVAYLPISRFIEYR